MYTNIWKPPQTSVAVSFPQAVVLPFSSRLKYKRFRIICSKMVFFEWISFSTRAKSCGSRPSLIIVYKDKFLFDLIKHKSRHDFSVAWPAIFPFKPESQKLERMQTVLLFECLGKYHKQDRAYSGIQVSPAWRLHRGMRRRLIIQETWFTR